MEQESVLPIDPTIEESITPLKPPRNAEVLTELLAALKQHDFLTLQYLMLQFRDKNTKTSNGHNLLHHVVLLRDPKALKIFLTVLASA